jgi:HEPN domain-containing protein
LKKVELVNYWVNSAEVDYKAMNNLFSSRDFVWSLFLGHLVIEKLIKAVAANKDVVQIPKIHDLNKLAKAAKITLDDELMDKLDIISSFNIEARYPDYKQEFYKKCDLKFTSENIKTIKEIRKWLLEIVTK